MRLQCALEDVRCSCALLSSHQHLVFVLSTVQSTSRLRGVSLWSVSLWGLVEVDMEVNLSTCTATPSLFFLLILLFPLVLLTLPILRFLPILLTLSHPPLPYLPSHPSLLPSLSSSSSLPFFALTLSPLFPPSHPPHPSHPSSLSCPPSQENLPAYLEAQLQYRMMKRIKFQLLEFLKGFYDVVPEPLLAVFDFQEVLILNNYIE